MHGGIEHGDGARWSWGQALALCKGTDSADRTIACFASKVRRGESQQSAIEACRSP